MRGVDGKPYLGWVSPLLSRFFFNACFCFVWPGPEPFKVERARTARQVIFSFAA